MKRMVAVLAVACLSGCASMNNRLAPEKLDPASVASDSAIVILSTGAADRCIVTATMLNLAPAGSRYGKDNIIGINVDAYVIKSDFPDHQGSLSAFAVKPGNYQLYPSILNPYVKPEKIPKAEISVAAGEVLYIGEFYMPAACSFDNITEFRDRESRDLALLKTRNPALAERQIVKRIPAINGDVRLD